MYEERGTCQFFMAVVGLPPNYYCHHQKVGLLLYPLFRGEWLILCITELVGMENKRRVVGPFHLPKVTLLAHVNIFWIIRIGIGEYFEYRRL